MTDGVGETTLPATPERAASEFATIVVATGDAGGGGGGGGGTGSVVPSPEQPACRASRNAEMSLSFLAALRLMTSSSIPQSVRVSSGNEVSAMWPHVRFRQDFARHSMESAASNINRRPHLPYSGKTRIFNFCGQS